MTSEFSSIILAGGAGLRFGANKPKQFMSLNGKSVVQYSVDLLKNYGPVILVAPKEYEMEGVVMAPPGKTRQESVWNGLQKVETMYVIVHDAARPLINKQQVEDIIDKLRDGALSVDTATPIVDGLLIEGVPAPKDLVMLSQTPEGFETATLHEAHRRAIFDDYQDDITIVWEELGVLPAVVQGTIINSKITYPRDIFVAESMLKLHQPVQTEPKLDGKHIMVVGGSGGIGSVLVEKLKDAGAKVFAPPRQMFDLKQDVMFLGEFDGVVHAAGLFEGTDEEIMRVNYHSVVQMTNVAHPGNFVVLGSTAGFFGREGAEAYSASKAALHSFVESSHERLAREGVYLNCIAPARVNTPLQKQINPDAPEDSMMEPEHVVALIMRYLDTDVHGHIIYLRKGFEGRL